MTTKEIKNAGSQTYNSPTLIVVEIFPEGVLCQSGGLGNIDHEGIGGDDTDIF